MDLLEKFARTILERKLLSPSDKVILAVSGGADSTAMMLMMVHFARRYFPLDLAVACLDHGLRPESADEAEWVKRMAQGYGLTFFTERAYLLEDGKHALEERARTVRYAFLERAARNFGASKIAVAHHADDQAETVLLHFCKGSGIQGISGMPFMRPIRHNSSLRIVRPLLLIHKDEILEYLKAQHIEWREDQSNQDTHFTRNCVRHTIFPFLQKQGYPQISHTLVDMSLDFQKILEYMQSQTENFWHDCGDGKGWCPAKPDLETVWELLHEKKSIIRFSNASLAKLPQAMLPFFLRKIVLVLGGEDLPLRKSHCDAVWNLLQCQAGCVKIPCEIEMRRTATDTFFLLRNLTFSESQTIQIPGNTSISSHASLSADIKDIGSFSLDEYRQKSSLLEAALSMENLSLPLVLRTCLPEDRIHPLGASGHRYVSRISSDLKVPIPLRYRIPVLCDNKGVLVWIPGVCIAHTCRVVHETKEVLLLKVAKKSG